MYLTQIDEDHYEIRDRLQGLLIGTLQRVTDIGPRGGIVQIGWRHTLTGHEYPYLKAAARLIYDVWYKKDHAAMMKRLRERQTA